MSTTKPRFKSGDLLFYNFDGSDYYYLILSCSGVGEVENSYSYSVFSFRKSFMGNIFNDYVISNDTQLFKKIPICELFKG